jgi:hypothetical protein
MTQLSLPVHSYSVRSVQASTARLVNCMAEQIPEGKTPVILTRTPGVSSFATVGSGPIQGMWSALGLLFVVSGGTLYKVTTAGVATSLGSVANANATDVDISDNGVNVMVTSGGSAYYSSGGAPTQVTDPDFRGALDVEFLDNYFLFVYPDSGVFFCADLGSSSSFDALNYATAEGAPDDLVGMKVDHRQVILLGKQSIELWENTGISGFPFERMINGFIEIGCLAGQSAAKLDNSVFWVANDYTVRRLEGATPARVSTHAVEQWLRTVTSSTLKGYGYSFEGHLLYELSATEGTFCYDVTTGLWHEKQTYGRDNWKWRFPTEFNGQIVVGDYVGSTVGTVSGSVYADNSSTLRAEWTYQPVYAEGLRAFHDRLEIVCQVGVGLSSGQGSAPEIMLDYSNDGGETWTSLPNRSLGALGNYQTRVVWRALGSARERVYRASVSDPVNVTILDTLLETRGGRL